MNSLNISSTETKRFKKRSGTTNLGNDYEDTFTTLVALRLIQDVKLKDFNLASNKENFGKFDDLVVTLNYNDGSLENYAIQVKHIEKLITEEMLSACQGKFSLQNYFHSYKDLKSTDYKYILYTSGVFKDFDCFILKETNIKILSHEYPLEDNDFFNSSGKKFKFQIDQESKSEETRDLEEFLEDFVCYANQENLPKMETNLSRLFQDTYDCSQTHFEQFFKAVKSWSNDKGLKDCLDKTWVQKIIGRILLTPYSKKLIEDSRLFLLAEICHQFDVVIFRNSDLDQFCAELEEGDFKDSNNLLVIRVNTPHEKMISKGVHLCKNNNLKTTFVLMGEGVKKEDFSEFRVLENLTDLNQDSACYEKVCKTFSVSLQSRDSVKLETVIKNDETMKANFTVDIFFEIITSDIFTIGEDKEKLPVYYVDQFLTNIVLNLDILNVEMLLQNEAKVNATHSGNQTPLHIITSAMQEEGFKFNKSNLKVVTDIVELLLKYKANINIKNIFGISPLDNVKASKNKELIDIFTRLLSDF